MTEPEPPPEPEHQPRDILSHLQSAAKELLAAGRAALDAADEVVSDRVRLLGLFMGGPTPPQAEGGEPTVERIEVERVDMHRVDVQPVDVQPVDVQPVDVQPVDVGVDRLDERPKS